jgi:hypothetical protein
MRLALASLAAAALLSAASCRTSPSEHRLMQIHTEGALIKKEIKDYRVIVSAHRGKVGYVKVYDVTEGGGAPYEWRYVYDTAWNELGFLDQFGGAYKYHYYSPAERMQQNRVLRLTKLPSDAPESNVLRILDMDPSADSATFPVATKADITGDTGVHVAGPGVVPSEAPAAEAK